MLEIFRDRIWHIITNYDFFFTKVRINEWIRVISVYVVYNTVIFGDAIYKMVTKQLLKSLVVQFINVSSRFFPSRKWYLCSLSYWLISTYMSRLKCSIIISHQVFCRNWAPGQPQQAWTNMSENCLLHRHICLSCYWGCQS